MQTSNDDEDSVTDDRRIKEKKDKFPTLYWLPKLHKARFIIISSSCTCVFVHHVLILG